MALGLALREPCVSQQKHRSLLCNTGVRMLVTRTHDLHGRIARIEEMARTCDLVGRSVVAVVNLPPRQIGPVRSQVLVLGVYQGGGDDVVLLRPDVECSPGDRIG